MAVKRNTKLGIGSYCYPYALGAIKRQIPDRPMSLYWLVDRACELGVEVVQIADNIPLLDMATQELDRLAQYAHDKSIILEIGARGIRPANLTSYIEVCRRLGATLLRCVPDSPGHCPELPEIHEILAGMLPLLKHSQITLGIETHDRFTTEVFAQIVKDANSPHIGIVLDTTNSIAQEETTAAALTNLAAYTVNLHIKDYIIRRRTDAMGLVVAGTPAGKGRLDIPLLIGTLRDSAPMDFSTILEFWMEPEEDTQKSVEKEDRWVIDSIEYLKQVVGAKNLHL